MTPAVKRKRKGTEMRTGSAEIDTTALDELAELRGEQAVIEERLAKLEEKRSAVTPEVFERVNADYRRRYAELEERGEPLRERARAAYARLREAREAVETRLASTRLDREEIALRAELGEFGADEQSGRLAQLEQAIEELAAEQAEAEGLRDRFLAAFRTLEELEEPSGVEPSDTPAAAEPAEEIRSVDPDNLLEATVRRDVPPLSPSPSSQRDPATAPLTFASGGLDSGTSPGITPLPPAISPEEIPDLGVGAVTFILKKVRLEVTRLDGSRSQHEVFLEPFTIGRAPENSLQSDSLSMSRRHAKITASARGYLLSDLGSENGVFVNGQRVVRHLLTPGDEAQVADLALLFHG